MANYIVSGQLFYDPTNLYSYGGTMPTQGIQNVPIVLQSTTTGFGVVALTASDGSFSFINVPNDDYIIVEAW